MRKYECAVIVAPGLSADVLKERAKRYADVITSHGGTLNKLDEWGKRSLAYEIQHHREGYYYFYKFSAENEVLKELNRQLRIDENVLRHMIVKDDSPTQKEPPPKAEPTSSTKESEKESEKEEV